MVFNDYRVSPNFLVVLGLWLRLGLGCDNSFPNKGLNLKVNNSICFQGGPDVFACNISVFHVITSPTSNIK